MSIVSTLALLATAVAAKIRKVKPQPTDVTITRLQTKIDDLNRELDEWRDLVLAYRDVLHGQHDTSLAQHYINEAMRQSIHAQMQANSQLAQAQMQSAQNQQIQNGFMFGQQMQAEQFSGWHHCNCVPARHDAFRGTISDGY